ncbi:hypothetical Protein YC6258_00125 [Gynuella sunshinyii YC6258]|uniref:Uncharacterized protein n=1 Tax=Gynuella sunshinyii YC6258 TaxID=1445510 RepID=A0A0C5VD64_9GAMM|nr:hypothetical Protein YC6258_00125 [Gynuella sunshinyii YC6258]
MNHVTIGVAGYCPGCSKGQVAKYGTGMFRYFCKSKVSLVTIGWFVYVPNLTG